MDRSALKTLVKPILLTTSFTCTLLLLSITSLDITLRQFSHLKPPGSRHFDADVAKYPHVIKNYTASGLTVAEVKELLKETWINEGWEYTPILGFKEKPRNGKYVNISTLGYRRNSLTQPTDTDLVSSQAKIYVFGGSTTFGYGVNDSATIPANLARAFPGMKVFNFGRGYYYSKQENILFDELLSSGIPRPQLAIFIDGVNERCDIDVYQKEMQDLFSEISSRSYNWSPREFMKPIMVIINKFAKARGGLRLAQEGCKDAYSGLYSTVSERFESSLRKRADLCEKYRIKCLTYIQPFPGYKNVHIHGDLTESSIKKANMLSKSLVSTDFHDTIDIVSSLQELKEHAYVDNVHYSAVAMKMISSSIAKDLQHILKK